MNFTTLETRGTASSAASYVTAFSYSAMSSSRHEGETDWCFHSCATGLQDTWTRAHCLSQTGGGSSVREGTRLHTMLNMWSAHEDGGTAAKSGQEMKEIKIRRRIQLMWCRCRGQGRESHPRGGTSANTHGWRYQKTTGVTWRATDSCWQMFARCPAFSKVPEISSES